MKKLMTPTVLLPILIGIVIGALLFSVGASEDAPGLCLIGLSVAFVLIMWGLTKAGLIKNGFLAPILLLCFGVGGVVLSIVLLLDGEFGDSPGFAIIGIGVGFLLLTMGVIRLKKVTPKA